MTPKSPLRRAEVVSPREDFTSGTFRNVLVSGTPPEKAKRVILCTGKIYWDLLQFAKAQNLEGETCFVRLEQIYPLDRPRLKEIFDSATNAQDFVWCQEEPANMGAWSFVTLATEDLTRLRYSGRKASASPATGYPKVHQKEQETLVAAAFGKQIT
jgi:2-oxoglutarate dehydrogenase E1 component